MREWVGQECFRMGEHVLSGLKDVGQLRSPKRGLGPGESILSARESDRAGDPESPESG